MKESTMAAAHILLIRVAAHFINDGNPMPPDINEAGCNLLECLNAETVTDDLTPIFEAAAKAATATADAELQTLEEKVALQNATIVELMH